MECKYNMRFVLLFLFPKSIVCISSLGLESDPLFQGIWKWISRGELPLNYLESFFISFNPRDNSSSVDLAKAPCFIDPLLAVDIYNTGNLIRLIQSNGIKVNFSDMNLYWKYYQKRDDMYKVTVLFKHSLREIKKFIFEVSRLFRSKY